MHWASKYPETTQLLVLLFFSLLFLTFCKRQSVRKISVESMYSLAGNMKKKDEKKKKDLAPALGQ